MSEEFVMFRLFALSGHGFVASAALSMLVITAAIGWSPLARATLAQSQVFTSWTPFSSGGADVTLTADTTTKHSGNQSLKFVNVTNGTFSGANGGLGQVFAVQPSTLYHLSAWVSGSNVAAGVTDCFVVDQSLTNLQCLPAGTYGWQQMTWDFTTGASDTVMSLALDSVNTGTVWVDDVSVVQNGTSTNLLANPGFENSTDSITLLYPTQFIFSSGATWLDVTSSTSTVNWTSADINGVQVGSGSVTVPSGGHVYLTSLPNVGPGWYSLHLTTPSGASYYAPYSVVPNSWINNSATPNPFGANMHPWIDPQAGVAAVGAAGLKSVRTDMRWELIETSPGVYTFDPNEDSMLGNLQGGGVKPVVTMGYSNPLYDGGHVPSTSAGLTAYAHYATAVAQHYGTNVDYDIFNEFNVVATNDSACGTTADCYYPLLVAAANAIHAAAPGARVVGPTVGGFTQDWLGSTPDSYQWLQRLLDLGGLSYIDVVDIHNYTWPIVGPPEGNNEAVISAVRSLVSSYPGGAAKPLWLTETGWPPFPGVVTELQQAQYVVRDAALSLRAGIAQYMFYSMLDDCPDTTNGNCAFGLMHNPDATAGALTPKPGITAYTVLARNLAGYSYASTNNWGTGIYSLVFSNGSANRRVAWAPAGNTTLAVQSSANVTVTNWDGSSTTLAPLGGIVTFSVGPDPVYVDGSGITTGGIATTPAFTATPPAIVHQATSVPIAVAVNGTATGAPTGSVTFSCAYGTTTITATAGTTASGTLTLSGFPNTGIVTVPVQVMQGTTVVGRLVVTMNVTP
jgi:hypothetical protein